MNLQVEQDVEIWSVKRNGVKVEQTELFLGGNASNPSYRIVASSEAAHLYPGKTVILGDSFIDASVDTLRCYLEEVHVIHWGVLEHAGDIIRKADTIIIESVEDRFPENEFLERLSLLQEILQQ